MKLSNRAGGRGPVARLVLGFILTAMLVQPSTTFEFSSIFDGPAAGLCAVGEGFSKAVTCMAELQEYVKAFKDENGQVGKGHGPMACCALTTFRYCITDDIKKLCGSRAKAIVDWYIKTAVGTMKLVGAELSCDGDEFYYRKESPLCWPWGLAVSAGLLAVLVLTMCCICCVKSCSSSSKKNHPVVVHLLPTNNPTSFSSPPPYTRLPNQDLTSSIH